MEALRKLEDMQIMLSFMQARGLLSNHRDSDRFLADLVLLLVQPHGMLNMDNKCHLISEFLPKISGLVLNEALLSLTGEGYRQNCADYPIQLPIDSRNSFGSLQNDTKNMAMIGLDAMQRANSTLEDFCRSSFMFHEMDVNKSQSVFRYLPILSFTESYIYQLDSFNEEIVNLSKDGVTPLERVHDKERNQRLKNNFLEVFKDDPFGPLAFQLKHHGLLIERIKEELRRGEEYWNLESKLCHALMSKREILIEDVVRAINLKSFDYRVLNLLLYQLRGKQVNDLHMEFLSISELLVEVSDDLFDYEDDVLENNFNILRMFVGIYGTSTAAVMLAKFITDAEVKYERLSKNLDPELSLNYQRRCEEATREGGKTIGHSFGTWSIPPVIADEESYRSNLLNSKPGGMT